MNSPEQNNYIQYVNQFGVIKTKSVVFTKGLINTTFQVSGINESFFILAVFQNNIKVNGVGFDDLENNDMLAFINSNLFDLSTIPSNAFLNSEQVVTMSYNNEYIKGLSSYVPLKTNELIYFESYLKVTHPNSTFIIQPFVQSYDLNTGISYDQTILFYAKNYGAPVSIYNTASQIMVQSLSHEWLIFNSMYPLGGNENSFTVVGYKALILNLEPSGGK